MSFILVSDSGQEDVQVREIPIKEKNGCTCVLFTINVSKGKILQVVITSSTGSEQSFFFGGRKKHEDVEILVESDGEVSYEIQVKVIGKKS